MKNKNKALLSGGFAAVIGVGTLAFKNYKRIRQWFKEDYHRHRMEMGCKICENSKMCPKCYYCLNCKSKVCEHCA